jgi:hypothetical protein
MPEVARVGKYVVVIYPRDHPPAHVHVRFGRCEARVLVSVATFELDAVRGDAKPQEVRDAVEAVGQNLDACLAMWKDIHGKT